MKTWILTLLGMISAVAMAQHEYGCATDEHMHQYFEQHPEALASFEAQQQMIAEISQNYQRRSDAKYIIPVVVHVMYSSCDGNISMAQIEDGLRILNEDFTRTNEDASLTRNVFEDVAADSEIEFRLARLDPDGDPTDGVVRVQTAAAVNAGQNVKSLSYWPSDMYMNIWVVESIANFTGGGGVILGYAQFPGSGSWNTYGLVVRNDAFGTIGTSNADGRTVTHEIGHCLNLYHTFQDGCGSFCTNSGDYVCDTPPAGGATYSCSFSTNTCSNDANGSAAYNSNVPDMIENYMSYNSCQNLFTEGQRDRMHAVLDNINRLEDLVSEDNLIATGVKGLVLADFEVDAEIICQGDAVTFEDASLYNASALSWEFGGAAIPGNSVESNPSVIFPYPGLHEVNYYAGDGFDSVGTTKSIFVIAEEGQYAPYTEAFDTYNAVPNDNWYAINIDNDEYTWKISTEAAYSGGQSLKMDNFGSCGNRQDELITQSFDFSPFTEVNISFRQAFARAYGDANVYLQMFASNNCGEDWDLVWAKSTSSLNTSENGIVSSDPFIPSGASEWQEMVINISNSKFMREGVALKLLYGGSGGNNLYIDDFSINGVFSGDLLLRSPEDGKQGMATDVLIDWKSVGFVDSYEYQIDKSPEFNTGDLITGTTTYIDATPDQGDTEFMAEGLDVATTYYWRVRYVQSGSESDWSETWSFTVSESGVGIQEQASRSWSVYPNPSNGQFWLESNDVLNEVRVIDMTGRVVWSAQDIRQERYELNTGLGSGVYLIQVLDATGGAESETIVIR